MDPTTVFCPNTHCHARTKPARAILVSIRSRSSASSAASVHKTSAPPQARSSIGCAPRRNRGDGRDLARPGVPCKRSWRRLGLTSAPSRQWARSGRQGQTVHEYLVEQPRDLGQVQADELRVKKQGGIVWMALAMMVTTRLWLGGEVQ